MLSSLYVFVNILYRYILCISLHLLSAFSHSEKVLSKCKEHCNIISVDVVIIGFWGLELYIAYLCVLMILYDYRTNYSMSRSCLCCLLFYRDGLHTIVWLMILHSCRRHYACSIKETLKWLF